MIPHMLTRYAAMLTAIAVLAPAAAAPAKTRYATAALLNHSFNARITLDGKAHGRQTVKDTERSATLSWAGDHVNAGFGVGGCPTPSGQDGAGSFQAQLYPRS
jgi:hypothetical protein